MGLSFGWKFLFPFSHNKYNFSEILCQLEMCIENSIPITSQFEVYHDIYKILKRDNPYIFDTNIQWLRFTAYRTNEFFKNNDDLLATRSDKGAHTVIIDTITYDNAINEMLMSNNYTRLQHNPLHHLIERETKLINFFKKNYQTNPYTTYAYEPNILSLPKFYGLVKVHKENLGLRPIISMTTAPGHASGKIFDKILNEVFERTPFHVKDAYSMIKFINRARINENQILVSFDVISMYTNIPRNLVIDIIMEKSEKFHNMFGIGKSVLLTMLKFLLYESTVFVAPDNKLYIQNNGLPMGGCISTTLARLVMDRVAKHLLSHDPKLDISFIRIFVDDTITAIRREQINTALKILNNFHPGIEFTHEIENANNKINFLNITLIRDGNKIKTNWFRKPYASGRLLNYFSSHKRSTITGTAITFIETVIALSDPAFFNSNRQVVLETLRMNSFPETTIMALMNQHYTLMRKRKIVNKNIKRRYVIFPHAICQSRKIKNILQRFKFDGIIYAESTKNTKINHVKTRKAKTNIEDRNNMIIVAKCQCNKRFLVDQTKFNQTVGAARANLTSTFDSCNDKGHAFKKLNIKRGLHYKKQTAFLLKYVKWKFRGKLENPGDTPNNTLAKLI